MNALNACGHPTARLDDVQHRYECEACTRALIVRVSRLRRRTWLGETARELGQLVRRALLLNALNAGAVALLLWAAQL